MIKTATSVGLTLTFAGWQSNLIVYLIEEFEVESIDAAQISNLVNGAGSLIPVLAAIYYCRLIQWLLFYHLGFIPPLFIGTSFSSLANPFFRFTKLNIIRACK